MKSKNILWPGITLLLLFSCKKNSSPPVAPPPNTPPPPSSAISISGISPNTGPFATVVTISGSNFSADAAKDTVWFNNIAAVVQQATATQLTVVVPKTAGTGTVLLRTGGAAVTGPVFTYVYTVMVTTLAGNGTAGMQNGSGTSAQFSAPAGLALNPSNAFIYVADPGNNSIRGVSTGGASNQGQYNPPSGLSSTVAGGGASGNADGNASTARFNTPTGVGVDLSGNVFVVDGGNNAIRKISPSGMVSTLAGGVMGFADGMGTSAKFNNPGNLVLDSLGNMYVSDYSNQRIRKVTPAGVVSTIAGSNTPGFTDGNGSGGLFNDPTGLAIDARGNIYVADVANCSIRKVTPSGVVTTVAGGGATSKGYADGIAKTARFFYPNGVAVDARGNLYVSDTYNDVIRMISTSGTVSTLAGTAGMSGFKDGAGNVALFNLPGDIVIDSKGNIYVTESKNNSIRKLTIE